MKTLTEAQRSLLESLDYGWTLNRKSDGTWYAVHKMGFTQRIRADTAYVLVQLDLIAIDFANDISDVFALTDAGVNVIKDAAQARS